jgi:RNA polymerase sigma factor (sigma-70 family)
MNDVIRHVRRASLLHAESLTDCRLLEQFLSRHDQAAFEALLRRHGPMVLGVCRRILRNESDAEDAFQATFLVLVRKATTLKARELLGPWLYGVAHRTALKARALRARRRTREALAWDRADMQCPADEPWRELLPLLDQELTRLPERYRVPIVLCDLEGGTRKEVARRLGVPEGTLSSRLAMARKLLRQRLARHRPPFSSEALAAALTHGATSACTPHHVITMAEAAVQAVSGKLAAPTVPARVITLTEGVLRTMLLNRVKLTAVVLVVLGIAALGVGAAASRSLPAAPGDVGQTDPTVQADVPTTEVRPEAQNNLPPALEAEPTREEPVPDSGKEATKQIEAADFTSVEVGQAFQVDITRGDKFRATVTGDDNLLPLVKAVKKGSTLQIHLDTGSEFGHARTLKVAITMPALEGVTASGASRVAFKGFKSKGTFTAEASGASKLEGEMDAAKLDLSVTGASKVILKGAAKEGKLSATGASHLLLVDFVLDSADVTLTGACKAEVQVRTKLDYALSGASHLEYQGEPAVGKQATTGASRASQKKK